MPIQKARLNLAIVAFVAIEKEGKSDYEYDDAKDNCLAESNLGCADFRS